MSNAALNGIEKQVLRGYITLQSGEVAVIWKGLKEVSPMDPGKFLYDISFQVDDDEQDVENRRALAKLGEYLGAKETEIKAFYPTVRRYGQLISAKKIDSTFKTYGLTPETDLNFMGYYAKDDGFSLGMSVETTPFAAPFWRDLALYGEVGLVQSSFSQPKLSGDDFYQQWLAGVRYIHPATETSVTLEYYYLEDGLDQKAREKIIQQQPWLNLPGQSAQHNIFINIQRTAVTKNKHPFTDALSLAARAFGNLEDQSRRVTAAITSEVIHNTQISLESTWYVGDDDTEYGSLPLEQTYSLVLKIDF